MIRFYVDNRTAVNINNSAYYFMFCRFKERTAVALYYLYD